MNKPFLYFTIFLLAACQKPDNSQRHTILLVDKYDDTLGVVSCILPLDFDTTYSWVRTSDCMCCDAVKYRSHSPMHKVVTEDGFLPDSHLDSGFYFTISHFTHISCDTSEEHFFKGDEATSEAYSNRFDHRIRQLEESGGSKVVFDTGKVINKSRYNIIYFTEKDYYEMQENDSVGLKTVSFNTLSASTRFRNRRVSFSVKSNVHDRDSFYHIAMDILKSIRIK